MFGSAKESLIKPKNSQKISCCEAIFPCFFKKKDIKSETIDFANPSINDNAPTVVSKTSDENTPQISFQSTAPSTQKNEYKAEYKAKVTKSFPLQQHPLDKFPINTLLTLKSTNDKKSILFKITEKSFNEDVGSLENEFSLANSKICNYLGDNKQKIPIPSVLKHIAARLQGNFCLDLSNGIGEYLSYWLKNSDYIISIFNNILNCKATENNLKNLEMDFLWNPLNFDEKETSLKRKFDVVFINPYSLFKDFCSKDLTSQEFLRFFRYFRQKSISFAMILSRYSQNLEHIVDFLSLLPQMTMKCGYEIQKIYCNNKLKYFFIFQGDISANTVEEELSYFKNQLLENDPDPEKNSLNVTNLLFFLSQTLRNDAILQILRISEEKIKDSKSSKYDIFKQLIKSTKFFKRKNQSVSSVSSNLRSSKFNKMRQQSAFRNSSNGTEEDASYPQDRLFSVEDELQLSNSQENENYNKAEEEDDEYVLSEYSINNTSNDDSGGENNEKTVERSKANDDFSSDDFEIIQSVTDNKNWFDKRKILSVSFKRDSSNKKFSSKKSFEEN